MPHTYSKRNRPRVMSIHRLGSPRPPLRHAGHTSSLSCPTPRQSPLEPMLVCCAQNHPSRASPVGSNHPPWHKAVPHTSYLFPNTHSHQHQQQHTKRACLASHPEPTPHFSPPPRVLQRSATLLVVSSGVQATKHRAPKTTTPTRTLVHRSSPRAQPLNLAIPRPTASALSHGAGPGSITATIGTTIAANICLPLESIVPLTSLYSPPSCLW